MTDKTTQYDASTLARAALELIGRITGERADAVILVREDGDWVIGSPFSPETTSQIFLKACDDLKDAPPLGDVELGSKGQAAKDGAFDNAATLEQQAYRRAIDAFLQSLNKDLADAADAAGLAEHAHSHCSVLTLNAAEGMMMRIRIEFGQLLPLAAFDEIEAAAEGSSDGQ
jgi:hypothetical protein